jgi:NTP pyrophosphatase (non-canonical NTP hydrolase)
MKNPLEELSQRALQIRSLFKKNEIKKYGRTWDKKDLMLGMLGDVGDLAKLVLAHDGIRNIPDKEKKIEHEFADCLWSLLVLADEHNVNLHDAFFRTMDELQQKLESQD